MIKFVKKYWIHLNVIFVVFFCLIQLLKRYILLDEPPPNLIKFSILGGGFTLLGLVLLGCSFFLMSKIKSAYHLIFSTLAYVLIVIGFIIQKDPNLEWKGSDVALFNFEAANESALYGPVYLIKTWNNRSNPYDTSFYNNRGQQYYAKQSARCRFEALGIACIAGDNWRIRDDLKVSKSNNRAFMHPPLVPVFGGFWLKVISPGRRSFQFFMIMLNVLSFTLLYLFLRHKYPELSFQYLPILVTSPVLVLYIFPAAEQLTMLLLGISVLILYSRKQGDNHLSMLAGVVGGLAFYSKFLVAFYLLFQALAFILIIKKEGWKPFVFYVSGVLTVVIFFTALDYYFWLTYITGKSLATIYAINYPMSIGAGLSKLLYFGSPLLILFLVFFLMVIKGRYTYNENIILIPLITGAFVSMLFLIDYPVFNRYLLVFLLPLSPFLIKTLATFELSKTQLFYSAVLNILFFSSIIYF